MLVLAPAIWTVGTIVLVPRLTDSLAHRYHFDLVPYCPLVITALRVTPMSLTSSSPTDARRSS
jgi:hypothetical protein